jgi:RNA polymerase sigma-70 factor (ECF subfamily)
MERALAFGPGVGVWEGLEEIRSGLRALLVRHCPDENDVEDVIQETFLRAARYRQRERVQSLRPWAMRIALNVLADAKRRGTRGPSSEPDEGFDPPAPSEPAPQGFRVDGEWLDPEAARELLAMALRELGDRDRKLLDSFYRGGSKTASTARACGLPRKLVKVRLYRARQRLLRILRQRFQAGSEGGLLAS